MKMDGYGCEMMGNDAQEESPSFGIRKIVDVKVGEDGKQMYKVKWEATWEPVENLVTCQHLIDEFWSFVNKAKYLEASKHNTNPYMNNAAKIPKIERISEDDKSDVQRLIARTNQTSAGNPTLMSPNMLFNQQNQQITNMNHNSMAGQHSQDQKPSVSPSQKSKITAISKAEAIFSPGKDKISNSSLKYLESFENPYVKIILVCKICNKEQSLKFAHNWKRHYLSHEEKPKKKQSKTHDNPPMVQKNPPHMMQQNHPHMMPQNPSIMMQQNPSQMMQQNPSIMQQNPYLMQQNVKSEQINHMNHMY